MTETDLCKVLPHLFLKVLWDNNGEGLLIPLNGLFDLLSMILGMSQRVVVFIQQFQFLYQVFSTNVNS